MHRLFLGSRAAKALEAAPPDLRGRLAEAIDSLQRDPRPPGARKLSGALKGAYRVRVGSYRVIYRIDDHEHSVRVLALGPRRSVYR